MKTSARNHFFGKVSKIAHGAVNDEIELTVAGGHKITAMVTHGSTQELGLAIGVEAFALIKASSIILVAEEGTARFSARNRLTGTVNRIQPGAINTEVIVDLSGGSSIAAIITNESVKHLGLAVGAVSTVLFKSSSVIVGVPA